MGAATPVGLGDDIKESDGRSKALNDLAALVRSLSHSRGRPSEPFEKMITKAESYTSTEALKLSIINGIVSSEKETIILMKDKKVNIDGVETTLIFDDTGFKEYQQTIGQQILEVLSNPSTAYILFLIGVALIYFEFQAPGGFIAGSVGVCFIIMAGIAFQVLPLDWGSLGLILAGIFLLILEVFIVSYGILSIAGVIAFTIGSLFLFHGETGFISIKYSVILSSLAGVATTVGFLIWYILKDQKKVSPSSFFLPVGEKGIVMSQMSKDQYQVKVRGEIWRAHSSDLLNINDSVEVSEIDTEHLSIKVKKSLL